MEGAGFFFIWTLLSLCQSHEFMRLLNKPLIIPKIIFLTRLIEPNKLDCSQLST